MQIAVLNQDSHNPVPLYVPSDSNPDSTFFMILLILILILHRQLAATRRRDGRPARQGQTLLWGQE